MDGYQLESEPFYVSPQTSVSLFRGIALTESNPPIVAKRHDFHFIQNEATQKSIAQSINAAIAQAKVQHPHSCDLMEVRLKIEGSNCAVFHILEALDGSVDKDIKERRAYSEDELKNMLRQISSALAYAHSKVWP